MYDRFLILLNDGNICYTRNFDFLFENCVLDVIKQERTFDNGMTWQEVTDLHFH